MFVLAFVLTLFWIVGSLALIVLLIVAVLRGFGLWRG